MDGQMNGWVEGGTDGRMDVWVSRWMTIDRWLDR